jgi:hypothetical protein
MDKKSWNRTLRPKKCCGHDLCEEKSMTATLLIAGAAWLVLSVLFVAAIGLAAKKPQPTE